MAEGCPSICTMSAHALISKEFTGVILFFSSTLRKVTINKKTMRYKDFFHAKDAIHCRDGQLRSRRSFFIKAKGFDLLPGPNGPERPSSVHIKQSLDVSSIRKLIDQMTRFVPNPAYRPGPRFRLVIFLLGAALAFSALTHPSSAFGAPPLPAAGDSKAGASKENLRALIEKIESPEQRTALLADLRLLLETLETKKKRDRFRLLIHQSYLCGTHSKAG